MIGQARTLFMKRLGKSYSFVRCGGGKRVAVFAGDEHVDDKIFAALLFGEILNSSDPLSLVGNLSPIEARNVVLLSHALGSNEAVQVLSRVVYCNDTGAKKLALSALGDIAYNSSIGILIEMLLGPDDDVSLWAASVIGWNQGLRIIEVVKERIKSGDGIRAEAVDIINNMYDKRVL
jgi:HEAT repeat protein